MRRDDRRTWRQGRRMQRTSWSRSRIVAACLTAGASGLAASGADRVTIAAGGVVLPDGTIGGAGTVVIEGGRFREIGPAASTPVADGVVDHSRAVLCAGLIDARSALGVASLGRHVERSTAIAPELSIREAIDVRHRDFATALRSGVTSALILPAGNNVVGGTAQAVRIGAGGEAERLREDGPLVMTLGQSVLEFDREPTSRIGAVTLLETALAKGKGGEGPARMRAAARGQLDVLMMCEAAEDLAAAARLLGGVGVKARLAYTPTVVEAESAWLSAFEGPIVLDVMTFATTPRVLRTAGLLAAGGKEVAFAGALPYAPADSLRISAALAARYGLDASAARRAITINPAKVAGVAERVGSIEKGKDADFVVFSGDPLRLESRVLEVYVKGVKVYDAALQTE
ncbi:MAG: Adenine deaminase [Phycisphaerae bacterium]|nr:Adenine deaminase [Phycisphaerae bacterium]